MLVLGGRRSVRSFGLWTLDLYIIRAFLTSYFVCAVSFTGLYIAVEAFTKIDRFIPSGQNSLLEIFTVDASTLAAIGAIRAMLMTTAPAWGTTGPKVAGEALAAAVAASDAAAVSESPDPAAEMPDWDRFYRAWILAAWSR